MGNQWNRERSRLSISRPGPQVRAAAAAAAKLKEAARAEGSKMRMRAYRARLATRNQKIRDLQHSGEGSVETSGIIERICISKSNKLALCIMAELQDCVTPSCKSTVMEKVLNHNGIIPMLLEYNPRASEAKSIYSFVERYRSELQAVKSAHSREFLARKGVLLDAAVSESISSKRLLSRVLQIHPRDIVNALERRSGSGNVQEQYKLLERPKRVGLSDYVKETVRAWWHNRSRVPPNKKDVTRRRTGKNEYVVHATHYLTDTQAQLFIGFKEAHPECGIKQRNAIFV